MGWLLDLFTAKAVADKEAGAAPLTGTTSSFTQAEQNLYNDTYNNS